MDQNVKNREEFLQMLSKMVGKDAKVRMLDSGSRQLKCTISAIEPNMEFIAVSNLETPIGEKKTAVLRVDDLAELEFETINV